MYDVMFSASEDDLFTAGWREPVITLTDISIDGSDLSNKYVRYDLEVTAGYDSQSLQVFNTLLTH